MRLVKLIAIAYHCRFKISSFVSVVVRIMITIRYGFVSYHVPAKKLRALFPFEMRLILRIYVKKINSLSF